MREYMLSRRYSLFGLLLFTLLFAIGRVADWPMWAYLISGIAAAHINDTTAVD